MMLKPHFAVESKRFRDIEVVPFTELLDRPRGLSPHRGGPRWPEWERQKWVRHCRGGRPIDDPPDAPEQGALRTIDKPLAWCGPIAGHFGHQIADFSTRIVAYGALEELPHYCFAVHPRSRIERLEDAPGYFREILRWLSVPDERVEIIVAPRLVREMVCVPQQEQLGGREPAAGYLDLLDRNFHAKRLGAERRGVLFVSRAGMSARMAGEGYLEALMAESGVTVVRPETLAVVEQLRLYAGAERLIFSEGSALHGLQLLGRGLGEIHVLNRRPGSNLAKKALLPRCSRLAYHDIGRLVHGLGQNGAPLPDMGITVPSRRDLLEVLAAAGVKPGDFSEQRFEEAVAADVGAWLEREAASPRSKVPGSMELIATQLERLPQRIAGLSPPAGGRRSLLDRLMRLVRRRA